MANVGDRSKSVVTPSNDTGGDRSDQAPRSLLAAVFGSIAALISDPSLDQAAPAALGIIGEALDVDRCVILESIQHAAAAPDLIPRYQWNRPGIVPLAAAKIAPLQGHPDILAWQAPLHEGKPVVTTLANASPAVKQVLRDLGLTSILLVPIKVAGKYWGQIGLDDSKPNREWAAAEIETLVALATLVGTAIMRGSQNRALAEADNIIRRSPTVYYRMAAQPGLPLTYISANVELLGYTSKKLLDDPAFYHSLVHPDDRQRILDLQTQALKEKPAPSSFELRMRRADSAYRWFEIHRTPVIGADGKVIAFEGELRDIEERKQAEERLALSNALLTAATENSPDGILIIDREQTILAYNQHFVDLWNVPIELMELRNGRILVQFVAGRVNDPASFLARTAAIRDHPTDNIQDEIELADGRSFERHGGMLYGTDHTKPLGFIFFYRDITARRRIEQARERANRALRMTNICNDIVIHATEEKRLLTDICQAIVDIGGYRLAWIGYAEGDAAQSVRPVALAGLDREYVEQEQVTWANDERGRGAVGTAIRTGHVAIVRDTAADPNFAPWRNAALEKGYRSTAALPLKADTGVYGVLAVYAGQVDVFDLEETELLTDLAGDISLATDAMRTKTARAEAEGDLAHSNAVLTATTENSPDGILVVDEHAKIISSNRRFTEIFQIPAALIEAKVDEPVLQHVASRVKDVNTFLARVRHLYEHPDETDHEELELVDGRVLDRHSTALRQGNGDYIGRIWFFRDITERKESERKLRDSENRFRTIFESVNDVVMLHDPDTFKVLDVNNRIQELSGYTRDEFLQLDLTALWVDKSPATRDEAQRRLAQAAASDRAQVFEWENLTKDGRKTWVEVTLRRAHFMNRDLVLSTTRDITERKEAEEKLRNSENRFRTIFESVNDVIMLHDVTTLSIVDANPRASELFGYTIEEFRENGLPMIFADPSQSALDEAKRIARRAAAGQPQAFEWHTKAKSGRVLWVEVTLRKARFDNRDFLLSTTRNITERKAHEQQVMQWARTDALTALPNRRVFVEALDQAIGRIGRGGKGFAVLYLDLDHFKDVNDTLGRRLGDELLTAVGDRLLHSVRATDVVARFGGDEFAVLQSDIQHPDEAATLAITLLETIAHPFKIDGNQIQIGTSIGITVNEAGVTDSETLLSHADLAVYRAKSEGRGTYRFFTESMDTEVHARVRLTNELREAIGANQFFVEYQPQVEVTSGRIVGVEALVRWRHPARGVLGPDAFIGVAEQSGLIVPIGHFVLAEACRQMRTWVDADIAPMTMSVNVSANQLRSPVELEQAVTSILAETGLSPRALEIELTETALMEKNGPQADVLGRLLAMGVQLAIDDFGTGYSSLEYLRRLPVDRIKIAQTFVTHIDTEPSDAMIVRAAISLARALNVRIIAEGVETETQLELIKSWRCDEVQGFYYARPLPVGPVTELLRTGSIVPEPGTRRPQPQGTASKQS
jgi:diguanylate cyclase (GGDEF)-like protein/PAS domain S-box-containing protein